MENKHLIGKVVNRKTMEGAVTAVCLLLVAGFFVSTRVAFADNGIFGIFEGMVSTIYADFMATVTPMFVLAFVFAIAGWAVFPNKRVNEACKNAAFVIVLLYLVLLLVVPLFSYLKGLAGGISTDLSGL